MKPSAVTLVRNHPSLKKFYCHITFKNTTCCLMVERFTGVEGKSYLSRGGQSFSLDQSHLQWLALRCLLRTWRPCADSAGNKKKWYSDQIRMFVTQNRAFILSVLQGRTILQLSISKPAYHWVICLFPIGLFKFIKTCPKLITYSRSLARGILGATSFHWLQHFLFCLCQICDLFQLCFLFLVYNTLD